MQSGHRLCYKPSEVNFLPCKSLIFLLVSVPVASLYVDADEPSLYSRREKLSLQYAIRLAANPSNPAHEVTFPPNPVDLYEQKPKAIKSFGIRISPLLEAANIKPQNIEKHFTPNIPAWCIKQPKILFDLHSGKNLNQIHTY